ncbi:hypothetical protein [Streptomyces sp. NPDC055140]
MSSNDLHEGGLAAAVLVGDVEQSAVGGILDRLQLGCLRALQVLDRDDVLDQRLQAPGARCGQVPKHRG